MVLIDAEETGQIGQILQERYRWHLEMDEYGEILIDLSFVPPSGFFVVTELNQDWRDVFAPGIDLIYSHELIREDLNGMEVTGSRWTCPLNNNREDARNHPMHYGNIVTGRIWRNRSQHEDTSYYVFEGRAGNTITIEIVDVTTEEPWQPVDWVDWAVDRVILSLESPSGMIIASSNDTDELMSSNPAIREVRLTEDGLYTITVQLDQESMDSHRRFILSLIGG